MLLLMVMMTVAITSPIYSLFSSMGGNYSNAYLAQLQADCPDKAK